MPSSELAKLLDRVQQGLSELNLPPEEEEEFCRRINYKVKPWLKQNYKRMVHNDNHTAE